MCNGNQLDQKMIYFCGLNYLSDYYAIKLASSITRSRYFKKGKYFCNG